MRQQAARGTSRAIHPHTALPPTDSAFAELLRVHFESLQVEKFVDFVFDFHYVIRILKELVWLLDDDFQLKFTVFTLGSSTILEAHIRVYS